MSDLFNYGMSAGRLFDEAYPDFGSDLGKFFKNLGSSGSSVPDISIGGAA